MFLSVYTKNQNINFKWSIDVYIFWWLDLLFEWLYKNDSLKALSEAGYFDNILIENDLEITNTDTFDKRNGRNPEYFEIEEGFCDNLIEVLLIILFFIN